MTRRLGKTRKEAMASMIMLSDMTLRRKAEERNKNIHHVLEHSPTGCAVKHNQHNHQILQLYTSIVLTHFSPGISNKLVSPVQLMSSFWEGLRKKGCAILSKKVLIVEKSIAGKAS